MPDTENPSQDTEASAKGNSHAELKKLLQHAAEAIKAKDSERARKLLQRAVGWGDISLLNSLFMIRLFRAAGQPDNADLIRSRILTTVEALINSDPDSAAAHYQIGGALVELDEEPRAEPHLIRAYDLEPENTEYGFAHVGCSLMLGNRDAAAGVARRMIADHPMPMKLARTLLIMFTHRGAVDEARALLDQLRPLARSKSDRALLDQLAAGIEGDSGDLDQHAMTVQLFDGFAENYDKKLEQLGNNGPAVLLQVLETLALPETKTRRILDAGCGTGLCAPFLRRWARELHGVDLSVGMLEKCKAKGTYDFLARTDLSVPHTYPDGAFDMLVCGDVLVYFGALDDVFTNFRNVLTPGGWLVFTVEDLDDPDNARGYRMMGSGRHKHNEAYLHRVLSATGFAKAKVIARERLRNELGDPIMGIAMAVQKPLLFGR